MKPPFQPLSFAGKSVYVSHYVHADVNVIQPAGFDDGPKAEEFPVAVVFNHFNRCYVIDIVRIVNKPNLGLSTSGLDHPDAEPWFLVKCFRDGERFHSINYMIVNSDSQFYPIRGEGDCSDTMAFIFPDAWEKWRGINWTTFSAIDKECVEAAIQAFLIHNGLR